MSSLAVVDEGLRQTPGERSQRTGLRGPSPAVVAIVLHRGIDTYLEQCLRSLYAQRMPLAAIVVAHNGSGEPPAWICQRFPNVSLLTASAPARSAAVVDTIIKTMPADGYLFQEATDWSAPDRLERLVLTAQTSGAELVGSSYVVVAPGIPDAHTRAMPPDGNVAFQQNTGGTVVEPCTMLVDRGLVERLGGFTANLSVAAANEFVARAAVAARVVNVSSALYFHREHDASDWSSSATGGSLVARVVLAALRERSRHHAVLLARRQQPDLVVAEKRCPFDLVRVGGPAPAFERDRHRRRELPATSGRDTGSADERTVLPSPIVETARPPVFVVSAFDSLSRFIACCLGQHPQLMSVDVTPWMTDVARLAAHSLAGERSRGVEDRLATTATAGTVYKAASAAVDALFVGVPFAAQAGEQSNGANVRRWIGAVPAVCDALMSAALLYPEATFLHVVRPVDVAVAAQLEAEEDADVEDLYSAWLSATRTILDVSQLLDARRMHTLHYEELVRDPDGVIRRCLESLDEVPEPVCAALFVRSGADAPPAAHSIPDLAGVPTQLEARRFSFALNGGSVSSCEEQRLSLMSKMLIDGGPASNRRRHATDVRATGIREDDRNPYAAAHDLIRRYAPRNTSVCVVSKGDEMAVRIRGHSLGWHFPQTEDGTYAGYHPLDAREAIEHLEHLRDRGAQLFLIPRQYLWWLSHYTELRQHLERSYVRVPSTEEEGALFDLRPERLTLPRRADGK